jgi:two-component system, cell cycle response regulator
VPNRRSFDDFLEREFARAKRYERPLSLGMFDLDHFKLVNDHHGHLAGDYVLGRLASTLRTLVRREELLARYGGEEFAIVMPETQLEKAEMFGEKVRSLVESTSFVFDGATIPVTVSMGLATLTTGIEDQMQLVKAADAALYEAKRLGRNRVCVAR